MVSVSAVGRGRGRRPNTARRSFRRVLAEGEQSPLPFPECAAMEIGREETAVRWGPEARPELPTLLDAGVVEEELRDRPAERSAWPSDEVTCQNTKVKVEPRPFVGEARAIT